MMDGQIMKKRNVGALIFCRVFQLSDSRIRVALVDTFFLRV